MPPPPVWREVPSRFERAIVWPLIGLLFAAAFAATIYATIRVVFR